MRIKKFTNFVDEAISGTEVPTMRNGSYFGPAYGDEDMPDTVDTTKNRLQWSSKGIVTEDQFQVMINNYMKSGGLINNLPVENGLFCQENIDFLNNLETNP
jgi:hypothetical protein